MVLTCSLCKNSQCQEGSCYRIRFYTDAEGVNHIRNRASLTRGIKMPSLGLKYCKYYDRSVKSDRSWRIFDRGGTFVELVGYARGINCPGHGVVTVNVPWADPGSSFIETMSLQSVGFQFICPAVWCVSIYTSSGRSSSDASTGDSTKLSWSVLASLTIS